MNKQEIEKTTTNISRNAYPNWFINKILTKLEDRNFAHTNNCILGNTQEIKKQFLLKFGISHTKKPYYTFSKKLRALTKNKFNVDINIYFKLFKLIITFN